MGEQIIAERTFTVDGGPVVCRFSRPEQDGNDFFCRYTIDWPKVPKGRIAWGVDGVQALLLAMQAAHVDLLMARKNDMAEITWIDEASLGLPLAQELRDLDSQGYF